MLARHDPASGSPVAESAAAGGRGDATDPLSDVLAAVRLSGAFFFLTDVCGRWFAAMPSARELVPAIRPAAQQLVSFHVVTRGSCWCRLAGEPARRLAEGDVVAIPHGDAYAMSSAPGLDCAVSVADAVGFLRDVERGVLPFIVEEGDRCGDERIHVLCGFLSCDVAPFNPVLAALPRLLHVPRLTEPGDAFSHLLALAMAEGENRHPGREAVLLRISELMFVEVVRRYLAALPEGGRGWLAGLRDPLVGRALALLHARPERAWTLAALARQAASSRSTLAERFLHFVGQPPMQYLAAWRLQLAARLLVDSKAKVATIADRVGYGSEAAFSRAFRRATGEPPATWRRRRAAGGR